MKQLSIPTVSRQTGDMGSEREQKSWKIMTSKLDRTACQKETVS
ncbi:MAG: hypothetical protein GQF41_2644 [Candidatus Rifleibacterium amylolyticum]|nr:MAG: hypothetical protein GQF41_2644 [Candidatus Rifleibacterium amylolyticum]